MFFEVEQVQHKGINASFHTGKVLYKNAKFNYIYDCGNFSNFSEIDEYLKSLEPSEKIDVIFISHFDADHLNGLDHILQHEKAKGVKCILPYLEECDKWALYYINSQFNDNVDKLKQFFIDPSSIFPEENEGEIIWVKHNADNYESPKSKYDLENIEKNRIYEDSKQNNKELVIGDIDTKIINDTQDIKLYYNIFPVNWLFLTYVYKNMKIQRKLRNKISFIFTDENIQKNGKEIEKIIKETIQELKLKHSGKAQGEKTDQSYANLISMSLYAGPYSLIDKNIHRNYCINWCYSCPHVSSSYEFNPCLKNRVAWLHTGDANLKYYKRKNEFNKHFQNYKFNVFFISVPHHGSKKNFHKDILPPHFCCSIITPNDSVCKSTVINYKEIGNTRFVCTKNKCFKANSLPLCLNHRFPRYVHINTISSLLLGSNIISEGKDISDYT